MTRNSKILLLLVGAGCSVLLLLCVLGLVVIGGLSIGGALALSQPAADVGDAFMTALREGDYAKAYTLCSPNLQRRIINPQALQFMIENSGTRPVKWSFNSRSVVNEDGILQGTVSLTGGEGTVRLTLVRVSGSWLVNDVELKLK